MGRTCGREIKPLTGIEQHTLTLPCLYNNAQLLEKAYLCVLGRGEVGTGACGFQS